MTDVSRRGFVVGAVAGLAACSRSVRGGLREERRMYGLIGKIRTTPGQRDTVVEALLEGTRSMPGCLSYVVALDPGDADAIWVTEVWESREHHQASLGLPAVQAAIARARPHIAGFGERFETLPVGGQGFAAR
ncbi:hypothetical protein GCM10007167_04950 [Vulcaniibacterium thermophilum]|jgi:quinol monooxygenase YgiN|uniref:ABM domain-containing protein n=2 Tax=Vulcaniibacterium thermophilum TaxID=1169913 RepID=A0A918YW85_9GAMM|nr:hypothetical protein GCM10007167_04950 [Vulcaniibacterium thermophilum]